MAETVDDTETFTIALTATGEPEEVSTDVILLGLGLVAVGLYLWG